MKMNVYSNLAKNNLLKNRIETIINRMSDPVIGLDESNKIIFANDRATDILNLSRQEIIGRCRLDAELKEVFVVHHVDLVHEDNDGRHADLTSEQDVLTGLGQVRPSAGDHNEDGAVHLGGARDHVLHVVGVSGAIDVRVVTTPVSYSTWRSVDRDAALFFFGSRVDFGRSFLAVAPPVLLRAPW